MGIEIMIKSIIIIMGASWIIMGLLLIFSGVYVDNKLDELIIRYTDQQYYNLFQNPKKILGITIEREFYTIVLKLDKFYAIIVIVRQICILLMILMFLGFSVLGAVFGRDVFVIE